jgi:hypothetical protein
MEVVLEMDFESAVVQLIMQDHILLDIKFTVKKHTDVQ